MDRLGMARALVVAGLIGPIPYVSAQETVKLPAIQVVGKKPHASRKKPAARIRRPAVTSNKPAPLKKPETVSSAPLPGGAIEASKIPANVQSVPASAFEHTVAPVLADAITRALPGVSRGDQTGNPFQPDFNYRGFTASPVPGTPEGIAVYQNGTRINEAFGDMVNWDLIPEMAIEQMTLEPNNPLYGLNALGGALAIEMKNGFNYHGVQAEAQGGSYGRLGAAAEAGGQKDNFSAYITADTVHDDGWRAFSSSSDLRRVYFDLGARGEKTEFHLSFMGADNRFGSVAATPIEMLNRDWSSVYTWPQTTHNQLAFVQASANYRPLDTLSLQANVYFRGLRQSHVDGNSTDAQACDPANGFLCFGNGSTPLFTTSGNQVPNVYGSNLGEIDRTWTNSNSFGGTVQATDTAKLFGHGNHFVADASIDRGQVRFTGNSELGVIEPNLFVSGTGVTIEQPASDLAPVDLRTTNTYVGLYAADTFDVTRRFSVTAGGRFNFAHIALADQIGTALNSDNRYTHFNPLVGLTYKITPDVSVYASYSEANRAPTPLELGCSDPARPCTIDQFLISDPPLQQVVAHTYEAGLRGAFGVQQQLKWYFDVYRTDSDNDIINVPSQISGFGYFRNAGNTRRQGFEAGASYKEGPWMLYANYAFVDATFQTSLTLSSPNNPAADVNGNIYVVPGDHIPAVPQNRFKAGFDYSVTPEWKLGADLHVIGPQYLIGDQSNQNPQVPAYWVVNLHTSYKISKNVTAFAIVQNLFNQHYYVAGTFFERGGVPFLSFSDPRSFLPGMPLAVYGGIRASW